MQIKTFLRYNYIPLELAKQNKIKVLLIGFWGSCYLYVSSDIKFVISRVKFLSKKVEPTKLSTFFKTIFCL